MEFCAVLAIILLNILLTCESKYVMNFSGDWLLRDSSSKYQALAAKVPGGIYSDLMNNNIIGDIFYGYNDIDTKWVPRLNWTYYRNFSVDASILSHENINLVFEGLDTVSTVSINDEEVGNSNNMFVRYIFSIKNQLKLGSNSIVIRFRSPIETANAEAEKQSKYYDIPQDCPPPAYNGECHVNMLRKMQASFSWDWGPSFPSVGIWKDVYVEAFNESMLRYVTVDVEENDSKWILNVYTHLANNSRNTVSGKIEYKLDMLFSNLTHVLDINQKSDERGEVVVTKQIEVLKPWVKTWWPNGYGSQDLYPLTVTFTDTNELEHDSKTVRVGFRTVELIEDTLDSGLSFYFKINHIPIFMKGSNEIPIDILPEKGQNKTVIRNLLQTARDSHMNMLRVWGGGVYESDYFYDIADEFGILIWQDFMFACSLYPSTDEFLNNVLDEVRHQVKRLSSHPCIVVFSGNNENEGALAQNWYNTNKNFSLYKNDYIKLYVDTIKSEFNELTHNKSLFITSSPSNGKESEKEGYVAKEPGSQYYGDVHYYNYLLDPFNSNLYPIPRFASEYGYQSLPSIQTWVTATNNTDTLEYYGSFVSHRQHHPLGNEEAILLLNYQFELPINNDSRKYMEAMVYYTQVCQAMSVKVETERYRSFRSRIDKDGKGFTMGALYWQLNDVWVAPTWSGIDYTGKWKMLQYFTQDFFAPVIVTGYVNVLGEIELYAVSDLLSPIYNATFTLQIHNWSTFEAVSSTSVPIDLDPNSAKLISKTFVDDILVKNKCGSIYDAKNNCFFYFTLQKEKVNIAPENYVVPSSFKSSTLQKSNVQIAAVSKIGHAGVFKLEVMTDNIAVFVWLDSPKVPGRFSENGFLQVTKTRVVYFFTDENATEDHLKQQLTITHLTDKNSSS